MKFCLLALVLTFSNSVNAETYYISSKSGDDSRKPKDAQNASTPWKTIDKLNSYYKFLKNGDVVLFKRGDIFEGSILPEKIEKNSNVTILVGAYGTGEKPVISGFQTIKKWKSIGGGIYESSDNTFPAAALNMVLFNDNLQPIGRWPKVSDQNNGYLTFQSHVGTTSITSNAISAAKSFVGGEVVIRKYQWIIDRAIITNQTSNTVSYTPLISPGHPYFTYEPNDGYGFFFQNHINALGSLGDWCYDPAAKSIKMFFGNNNPENFRVQIAVKENLITLDTEDKITFDNISFIGANSNAFNISNSTNITINNCDISFSGRNAINVTADTITIKVNKGNFNKVNKDNFNDQNNDNSDDQNNNNSGGENNNNSQGKNNNNSQGKNNNNSKKTIIAKSTIAYSNNITVINCTITNTNNNAINGGNANNWIIRNNVIKNTGMIRGMGASGDGQYEAIQYINSNSLVENNDIINTGYIGIHFVGDNTTIRNNFIDKFCLVKSDGGGIYTYGATGLGRKITGNIVSNGSGDIYGMNAELKNPTVDQVHGIYMDGNSNNVTIENNSVFGNSHSGLFLGSSTNMIIKNNIFYNNKTVQIKGIDSKGPLNNITINNNILVSRDSAQLAVSFMLRGLNNNPAYNIGAVDYNYYCRPLYEPQGIKTQGYPNSPTYFNYPAGGVAIAYDQLFYSLDGWQTLTGWDLHTQKSPQTIHSLDSLRFEFNPSNISKKITLNGTFVDMKNQLYNNSVVLPPYSSIVLIQKNVPVATQSTLSNSFTSANGTGKFAISTLETTAIRAFPNPFSNTATIVVRPEASGESSVDLFNQEGRLIKNVYQGSMEAGATKTFNICSGPLGKGVYFIRFANKGQVMNKKITVE